ncbi:FDXHR family putative zinc-binding protein [Saccharopolyspora mangrovi]|uniref:Phage FDXHR zinc binding domain-containing protein n=1 Tax=Saccharopolyspora mangrovi TaxID=3082379 RepID=A0ABU6A760_9PSEU|nr:hypothetical protein [Saccharopolyspora sp. S2-29]MEB3367392.1 hypothetical protein [Saccharopolyspora sp. S2-29]
MTEHTCSGCPATWKSVNRCHCSGCHRTFSGLGLFDRHRRYSKCVDPATVRTENGEPVMVLRGGMWGGPEILEEDKWWK